ncbi:MAG: GTPase HflX [Candidatus Omnitrophica bacterium]|nr:GTPase HflX [Candidatus Omnitrophota bacterium]
MEKAILVTLDMCEENGPWSAKEKAAELRDLAMSSGASIAHEIIAIRGKPSPAHYVGTGKAGEIAELCAEKNASVVIFNNDLSGTQQKNLEEIVNVKTIDRTQLILDIFAHRAKSSEGKIQVELAQLLYLLPRLTGFGIMLSRLGGGIGTRGPGEQKLEVNKRTIRARITKLKKDLEKLNVQRLTRRKQREKFSLLKIAIIGYTNSGKSTLLNALTGSGVIARDRLFSTLDPTIRSFTLPNNQKVIFSDTVGFLSHLPHHLIESFKATLEEVVNADLLLHIVDISHPKAKAMEKAVFEVLDELGAREKPIITVLNKIDRIDPTDLREISGEFTEPVRISALKKANFEELFDRITLFLSRTIKRVTLYLPQTETRLIGLVHERGNVIKKEYIADKIRFEVELPISIYEKIKKELRENNSLDTK